MKRLAVALVLLALPALAQSPPAPLPGVSSGPATAMTPTPDDRAKQWLTLIDDGNYADAWKQAGPHLRAHQSADGFLAAVSTKRMPMGAMSARNLKDLKMTKILPGMRSGQYAVVRYDSAFAHQAQAVETVTLMSENGAWSVIAYHVDS